MEKCKYLLKILEYDAERREKAWMVRKKPQQQQQQQASKQINDQNSSIEIHSR